MSDLAGLCLQIKTFKKGWGCVKALGSVSVLQKERMGNMAPGRVAWWIVWETQDRPEPQGWSATNLTQKLTLQVITYRPGWGHVEVTEISRSKAGMPNRNNASHIVILH